MKKLNYIFLILGIIFTVLPYFFKVYSLFRLLSLVVGTILIILGLIVNKNHYYIRLFVYPVIAIFAIFFCDFSIYKIFDVIPVVAIRHKSSSKVSTYNSLLYRVYDCAGRLTYDNNYKKTYVCSDDAINVIDINKFLEDPKTSYKKYKGKFVHLQGKITTIIGNSTLVLNAYSEEVKLNGYVEFNQEKMVHIDGLEIDPSKFYIYDVIEVVGLVKNYNNGEDKEEIHLIDAKIIENKMYDEYELSVNNIDGLDKVKITENMYNIGIEGIYYKYDENNIYELTYLLTDERETLDNLTKDVEPKVVNDDDKVYELNDFNLIMCENKQILFVNKNISKLDNLCKK